MLSTDCPTPWKVPHLTRSKANLHLIDLKKTQARSVAKRRTPLEVYGCGDHWHVGHAPRPMRG